MTKFEDQLYDDLMRAHGHALARTTVPASPKHRVTRRRTLLAAGGALAAAAAIAGTLVAGGGTPAYAVTKNPDGSVTVAVYQESGIAGANARLKQLGDSQVVVVPIEAGCPAPKAPAVSPKGHRISMGEASRRTAPSPSPPPASRPGTSSWSARRPPGRAGLRRPSSPRPRPRPASPRAHEHEHCLQHSDIIVCSTPTREWGARP